MIQQSIEAGIYEVETKGEPVYIETILFLVGCLQIKEENRMDAEALLTQPFVSEEFASYKFHNHKSDSKSGKSNEADSSRIELTAWELPMANFLYEKLSK